MKKFFILNFLFILVMGINITSGQQWKYYTWDSYSTKFKIPIDFRILESTGEKFSATNDNITLTIYPFYVEYKTYEAMEAGLTDWAQLSHVQYNQSTPLIKLDSEKMNGYWGMLLEGYKDEFPVVLLLMADPDYPDIALYVWISYYEDQIETVIEILKSFTPN